MNFNYNGKYMGTPVNKQFKTPSAKRKLKVDTGTVKRSKSDSDESISSNPESVCSSSNEINVLSVVALFDELMRSMRKLHNAGILNHFISNGEDFSLILDKWKGSNVECHRLQLELDKKTHELSDIENKLSLARKLLDQERKLRKREVEKVENERNLYLTQLSKLRTILTKDCWNNIPREARDNLRIPGMKNLSECNIGITSPPQNFIPEGNTTGSLLSDFSYSMSEDDFDGSKPVGNWQKYRPSLDGKQGEPATKKRRSSGNHAVEINNTETVRATTTLTVAKKGPITATSVIESIPKNVFDNNNKPEPQHPVNNVLADLWKSSPQKLQPINTNIKFSTQRAHSFQMKTIVMPDTCGVCEKRIRFAKNVVKCKVCRSVCHPECKDKLPLPCIPCANTPTHRLAQGVISDYTPTTAPMVPAIVIHCLNEIEAKGLKELGIYRIPGAEKDVKGLKDRFFKGKGAPVLNNVDVHVICGVVKDFLRFLREPLVSKSLRGEFIKAVECSDEKDVAANLCQIISELPQPNRDTLAYIIVHLKKVAESKECKMPLTNLAKVFGPTIVGFSSVDLEDMNDCLKETSQQYSVMIKLLELPLEYWQDFIIQQLTTKLQQTPSTDSLLRPTPNRLFSTRLERDFIKKRKNILSTPSSLLT